MPANIQFRNFCFHVLSKSKSIPVQAWIDPEGYSRLKLLRVSDSRHIMVARLSSPGTGRPYPPREIQGTHFCWRLNRPQSHRAAGRIGQRGSRSTRGKYSKLFSYQTWQMATISEKQTQMKVYKEIYRSTLWGCGLSIECTELLLRTGRRKPGAHKVLKIYWRTMWISVSQKVWGWSMEIITSLIIYISETRRTRDGYHFVECWLCEYTSR
jgi:hypothetical protein